MEAGVATDAVGVVEVVVSEGNRGFIKTEVKP